MECVYYERMPESACVRACVFLLVRARVGVRACVFLLMCVRVCMCLCVKVECSMQRRERVNKN